MDLSWNSIESFDNSNSEFERLVEAYCHSEKTEMTAKNKIIFAASVSLFVVVVVSAWILGT